MRWPDRAFPWLVPAVQQGLEVLRRKPEAVIFSTSPPPTAHLVAACLARLTGRPWIADLRDPWTSREARGWPWQAAESALERQVLRGARRLVTVSPELAAHLAGYHGRPVDVITNGFDPATEDAAPRRPRARLTLTYTGTIYRPQQDPELLLGGLARLRAAGELPPGAVDLRFFGADLGDVPLLAERLGVADCVSTHAWVSRAEALARQRESHALLLLDWAMPEGVGVLTYKVFEYLQARRPVLAVGPRCGTALAALLAETGAGTLCTTPAEVAGRIGALLSEHRATGDVAFAARPEAIERYSARRLAGQLAALLGSVLEP
jgi:glycosyltransferase involved in cell wall biosynthesis